MRLPRRFDNALMQAPDTAGHVDAALLASLRAWCEDGALPALTQRLRVASIAPQAGLDAVACALDGSHALARLGRWHGLLWRLRILGRELIGRDGLRAGDPWDCGWWRGGPLDPARAFRPRRATLLLLREPDPAQVAALLATLGDSSPTYRQALRVLVVSAAPVAGMPRL